MHDVYVMMDINVRYARDDIIGGPGWPNAGHDRHNGEIAAFHLDGYANCIHSSQGVIIEFIRILGFRLAPPVAGRRLNLTSLLPVTTKKLHDTYVVKGIN